MALGISRRAPSTCISTPRMSWMAGEVMGRSSSWPTIKQELRELAGFGGLRATGDQGFDRGAVVAAGWRLCEHHGALAGQGHRCIDAVHAGTAEEDERAVASRERSVVVQRAAFGDRENQARAIAGNGHVRRQEVHR